MKNQKYEALLISFLFLVAVLILTYTATAPVAEVPNIAETQKVAEAPKAPVELRNK